MGITTLASSSSSKSFAMPSLLVEDSKLLTANYLKIYSVSTAVESSSFSLLPSSASEIEGRSSSSNLLTTSTF